MCKSSIFVFEEKDQMEDKRISYWVKSAENDWDVLLYLLKGRKYVYALFFGHLYLEKLCKALWVKHNKERYPPKIHNLVRILELANVKLDDNDMEFLGILNQYQIEGRYPDYISNIAKETTKQVADTYIERIKIIALCLKEKLV